MNIIQKGALTHFPWSWLQSFLDPRVTLLPPGEGPHPSWQAAPLQGKDFASTSFILSVYIILTAEVSYHRCWSYVSPSLPSASINNSVSLSYWHLQATGCKCAPSSPLPSLLSLLSSPLLFSLQAGEGFFCASATPMGCTVSRLASHAGCRHLEHRLRWNLQNSV